MITLYKNIKEMRLRHGMSQSELAEKMGYSDKSMISKIEAGKVDLTQTRIVEFAKVFDMPPGDLMGWEEPNVEPVHLGDTVKIPVYGRIPAGIPFRAIQEIEDYIDVPAEDAKDGDLFALKVVGNSMYPKYLSGDYVIIKRQSDCESGQDCAVRVNGNDATLKTVIKKEDGLTLKPVNPEYMEKHYKYDDVENPVFIMGIVKELRRKI